MSISLYVLKPRFQSALRPLVRLLHTMGVTANQITLRACFMSSALGLFLYFVQPAG